MKLLTLTLLIISFHFGLAGGIEPELQMYEKDVQGLKRVHQELLGLEQELRARLHSLRTDSLEAMRIQEQLKEIQAVLNTITERERISATSLRELQSSPLHLTIVAIAKDKRHPSKSNISGVWGSGLNLVGYDIQLELKGTSVTGKGLHWGCSGVFDPFQITGTYRGGLLSLTFIGLSQDREKHLYKYAEEDGKPGFEEVAGKYVQRLRPNSELH